MGRKRTGSVYEKPAGSGRWWYSFLLRSGKRWTKPVPPRPDGKPITEADAELYKTEVLRRYDLGLWDPEKQPEPARQAPTVPTIAVFAERWAKALPHDTAEQEQRQVEHHIAPHAIGALRIDLATPRDVAAWVMELRAKPSAANGAPTGGTLAPSTVRGIFALLSKMFLAAMFEGLVASNPCDAVPSTVLPKKRDKVPGARRLWRYSREELVTLISDQRIPPDRRVLYTVLFLTGVRVGEAVVLRWRDLDSKREPLGCLAVVNALASRDRSREKSTKTDAAREVPVHPTLASVLARWRQWGWRRHVTENRLPSPDDFIVPARSCKRRHPKNVYNQLQADCGLVEVRPRRVHGTRHTFISLAIDDGARSDIIKQVTHTRPVRSSFDLYRTEAWPTLCAEVEKLRVRLAAEMPLWRAVGASDDSATDSATALPSTNGNTMQQDASIPTPEQARFSGTNLATAENAANQGNAASRPGGIPASGSDSGGDSATASSVIKAVGPHTGEAYAQLWFETVLLAQGEP